jgi:hypothetical protein
MFYNIILILINLYALVSLNRSNRFITHGRENVKNTQIIVGHAQLLNLHFCKYSEHHIIEQKSHSLSILIC